MDLHIYIPTPREGLRFWGALAVAALAVTLVFGWGRGEPVLAAGNSITFPDTSGSGHGNYTSLTLDATGNPVVSNQQTGVPTGLKVVHCNDQNCAGSNESVQEPDAGSNFQHSSIELDGAGNPVVSYYQNSATTNDLKLMHCNDPNCDGAVNGAESVTSPHTTGNVGLFTSLELDAAGNPVVSYYNTASSEGLNVLHCNDPNCDGVGESIKAPDPGIGEGQFSSIVLDTSGNPVISYLFQDDLQVMHCNDANCDPSAGAGNGPESITAPDTGGEVGYYTSLALDTSGNPVVSYYDVTNGNLKVLHCNDANCSASVNGPESLTSPDTTGDVGQYTSLALDPSGNPVVSYQDVTNADLKIMHCNDPNCAGGDDTGKSLDTTGSVGQYTSLALDGFGRPVVSYQSVTAGRLKLLHCSDPNCQGTKRRLIDIDAIGQYALPKSCFEVRTAAQAPLFTVCDDDSGGTPVANAACLFDGICNDEDPTDGSISVGVTGADYRVVESQPAPEHTAVTGKLVCNTTSADCSLTYLNTPNIRPWFPWDLVGQSGGPPDGLVRVPDILAVVNHFFQDKPIPTPTPPP